MLCEASRAWVALSYTMLFAPLNFPFLLPPHHQLCPCFLPWFHTRVEITSCLLRFASGLVYPPTQSIKGVLHRESTYYSHRAFHQPHSRVWVEVRPLIRRSLVSFWAIDQPPIPFHLLSHRSPGFSLSASFMYIQVATVKYCELLTWA